MLNLQASGNVYGKRLTLVQINKTEGKRLFSEGKEIYLQSSNMSLFNMWQSVCAIKYDEVDCDSSIDAYNSDMLLNSTREEDQKIPVTKIRTSFYQFDSICNEYKYYNCDSERGNYIHFFKSI